MRRYTNKKITDDGYDYFEDASHSIGIWLTCKNAETDYLEVVKCFKEKKITGNDFSKCAEIYIGEEESADIDECRRVYPSCQVQYF